MKKVILARKSLSILLICLITSNFLYTTLVPIVSGVTINPNIASSESSSYFGSNSYVGSNCTKLGEYDSNLGESVIDFSAAEFSNKKVAYVATTDSVLVFDYSKPKKPKYISSIEFDNEIILHISAIDNFLIVNFLFTGVAIFDFSYLRYPKTIFEGQIGDFSSLRECIIEKNILYGLSGGGLAIIDVSTISSPEHLDFYGSENSTLLNGFYLHNNYAYLAYSDAIEIVDITNSKNPTLKAIFNSTYTNGTFTDIAVLEDVAYSVTTGGQLFSIDCSTKSNPILLDYLMDDSKTFTQITIVDSNVYVLDEETGIHVFDVSSPTGITMNSSINASGEYETQFLIGSYLILYDLREGIEVYSIYDSQNPELVSTFYIKGRGEDIAISGNTILVANGGCGLEIYQTKANSKPKLVSRILSSKYCQFVQVRGTLAYVYSTGASESNINIVDFSDVTTPVLLHTESLSVGSKYPSNMQISGDLLVVSYQESPMYNPDMLRVYNLCCETNFEYVDTISPGYFLQFAFQNNFLYILNQVNLATYSINPQNIALISQTAHNHSYPDPKFHVSDNYAFITDDYDTFMLNITDPFSIHQIFRFADILSKSNSRFADILIKDKIIYAIEFGSGNLYFINFENENAPYLEGRFNCDVGMTSLAVYENKVYITASAVNLIIVQLNRFRLLRTISIVVLIVSILVVSGIAVFVVVLRRRKNKNEPKKEVLDEEPEIKEEEPIPDVILDSDELDVEVKKEEFDSKKLYKYAKEIYEKE